MHVHIKRYTMEELPEDPEELSEWVRKRWEEKDRLIDNFINSGRFPNPVVDPYVYQGLAMNLSQSKSKPKRK